MTEMPTDTIQIPVVTVNKDFISVFAEENFPRSERNNMLLTEQIPAVNLRLRESEGTIPGWHVAGDPTLIIIQQSTIRIILRDGTHKDFGPGDMFIAKDYLPADTPFDNNRHGHRAEVIAEQVLKAVHIKLSPLSPIKAP